MINSMSSYYSFIFIIIIVINITIIVIDFVIMFIIFIIIRIIIIISSIIMWKCGTYSLEDYSSVAILMTLSPPCIIRFNLSFLTFPDTPGKEMTSGQIDWITTYIVLHICISLACITLFIYRSKARGKSRLHMKYAENYFHTHNS